MKLHDEVPAETMKILSDVAEQVLTQRSPRQIKQQEHERIMKRQLAAMSNEQRRTLIRSHSYKSRFFWLCTIVLLSGLIITIRNGAPFLTSAAWACWSVSSSLLALNCAFRAWQIETRTIFVTGAYGLFLRNERWFR